MIVPNFLSLSLTRFVIHRIFLCVETLHVRTLDSILEPDQWCPVKTLRDINILPTIFKKTLFTPNERTILDFIDNKMRYFLLYETYSTQCNKYVSCFHKIRSKDTGIQ